MTAEQGKSGEAVPVIGLAGGVGSGKSTVARVLASLGCVVLDADVLAKAALDRPEVRATLRQWWGDGVLGADGRVDRAAVGRVVFEDAAQRERLEKLIHPIVHAERARLRGEHLAAGPVVAFVEDAPLLFEAGMDRECDAVIFVDAPREVRVERVRRTRGWDEAELARREKNQWPLDIKRSRADYVVVNAADQAQLEADVRGILSKILHPQSMQPGPA